jgi:hypothetical protein
VTQPTLPESPTDAAAPVSRRRPRFLLPLGLFLAVSLLSAYVLRPKPVPPPVVRVYTVQQAATAQQHVAALSAQLLPPAPEPTPLPARPSSPATPHIRQKAAPRAASVHLQLSEADLNTILATNSQVVQALRAHSVSAVQILLREPQDVDIRAAVTYKGHPANMEIVGTLQASRKTIVQLVATHAQIGRVLVPPGVVTREAGQLADQFTKRIRGRMPLQVQQVQVIKDDLVLTGVRLAKPRR